MSIDFPPKVPLTPPPPSSSSPSASPSSLRFEEMSMEGKRKIIIYKGSQSIFAQIVSPEEWEKKSFIYKKTYVPATINDKKIYIKIKDITSSHLMISEDEIREAAEKKELLALLDSGFDVKDLFEKALGKKVEGLTLPLVRKVTSVARKRLNKIGEGKSVEFSEAGGKFIARRFDGKEHIVQLRIQEKLGAGTFGKVSKVYEITKGEFYAVKSAHYDDPYTNSVIDTEGRKLEELAKSGAKGVQESPIMRGSGFLVGKLYELGSLDSWMKKSNSATEKMDCCQQLWKEYLKFAQTPPLQLYHGDIKPANVFITREGGKAQFKIGDWAGVQKNGEISGMKATTKRFTPPNYRLAAEKNPSDFATLTKHDIYALGATMYLALTNGQEAYTVKSSELMEPFNDKLLQEMGYPKELIDIIRGMVQLDPSKQTSVSDLSKAWEIFEKIQSSSSSPPVTSEEERKIRA